MKKLLIALREFVGALVAAFVEPLVVCYLVQQKTPPFLNVVATGTAIGRFPFQATLNRAVLVLGGTTFTKAMITGIRMKIGSRKVYEITGSRLDSINQYKGLTANAAYLSVDFTEPFAREYKGEVVGGYDITTFKDELTMEVDISGATAPTLNCICFLDAPQKNPLIRKLVYVPAAFSAGGKQAIVWNPSGALIERLYMFHGGNMTSLEVRKNGGVLYDTILTADQNFWMTEYKQTPQANLFVYDPVVTHDFNGAVVTSDARSFEINPILSAADTISMYAQVIDVANNL